MQPGWHITAKRLPGCGGLCNAERPSVTNRIAIVLGAVLIALILVDVLFFSAGGIVFLGRRLLDLIDWLAFWR